MDDFIKLLLAGILSGSVISSVMAFILYSRTTKIAEDIKSEYAKGMIRFESSRVWKEKSVSELLGPPYMQFDRQQRALHRWEARNLFLEAKVFRDGNLTIRDLLLNRAALIPPELLDDAGKLIEHYDRWLEEFERIRGKEKPDQDTPFVFVGPQGFPFPKKAETKFRNEFGKMWKELYGVTGKQ